MKLLIGVVAAMAAIVFAPPAHAMPAGRRLQHREV